jgi:hypothetical protein
MKYNETLQRRGPLWLRTLELTVTYPDPFRDRFFSLKFEMN